MSVVSTDVDSVMPTSENVVNKTKNTAANCFVCPRQPPHFGRQNILLTMAAIIARYNECLKIVRKQSNENNQIGANRDACALTYGASLLENLKFWAPVFMFSC